MKNPRHRPDDGIRAGLVFAAALIIPNAGYGTLAKKTSTLSDEKIISQSAGTL
jgi:hypothetical protein